MKRISEITIATFIMLVLLPISTYGNRLKSASSFEPVLTFNKDTTGLMNLLVVDTFSLRILPPSSGVQFYKDKIVFLSMSKNEEK